MESRGWIPENTGSGVLLTGYNVGEKDVAFSEMTPDLRGEGDSTQGREPRKNRRVFLVFKKGRFRLDHFKFEHLRLPWAVRSMIKTCLVTMLKG